MQVEWPGLQVPLSWVDPQMMKGSQDSESHRAIAKLSLGGAGSAHQSHQKQPQLWTQVG